jgi:hypothetical protein
MPDLGGVIDAAYVLCASEAVAAHAAHYPSRAEEYGPYFREFLQGGARATEAQLADARKVRRPWTWQARRPSASRLAFRRRDCRIASSSSAAASVNRCSAVSRMRTSRLRAGTPGIPTSTLCDRSNRGGVMPTSP